MKAEKLTDKPTGKYGLKAYGKWFCFNTKRAFKAYLGKWIANTDGSERNRAYLALQRLEFDRVNLTDTDAAR